MKNPSARIVSVHDESGDWIARGDCAFNALYFGAPEDPTSPVAVFLRAGRDVADRIAGSRTHDTPVLIAVISGTAEVDGQWLVQGEMQVAEAGAPHGDLVIGPEGATLMLLFAQRRGLVPSFVDEGDRTRFETLRPVVELAAAGRMEESFVLLPGRDEHTPRRGIKVLDHEPVAPGAEAATESTVPPPGLFRTSVHDETLPWGPPVLNARTAMIILGDADDKDSPTVGVINVTPGPGDRLRGRHVHKADAVNLIIEGALYMDGQWLRAGEAKIVDADYEYGDGLAGPDGVRFLEIWSAQGGAEPVFTEPDDQAYFELVKAGGHLQERRSLS